MAKYRVLVSFDGKNFFWIVVDNGKLINNPAKEDLKGTKFISYNKTNICPRCREEHERDGKELTDKSVLYPGNVQRETDKKGKRIEKWICKIHGNSYYERYSPNSTNNLKKSLRDNRTDNLNPSCNTAKGDLGESVTSIWRGVKKLSVEYDNYELSLDHSPDPELGIIQTKCSWYDIEYGMWSIKWKNDWYKKFDYVIVYCISADGSTVERIYIFPREEVIMMTGVTIYKNPKDSHGNPKIPWYEKYRLKDKEQIKKINEIWNNLNIK